MFAITDKIIISGALAIGVAAAGGLGAQIGLGWQYSEPKNGPAREYDDGYVEGLRALWAKEALEDRAANRLADPRADKLAVAKLVPICAELFRQGGDLTERIIALKSFPSKWEQGAFVEKGGWATRPGATSSDYILGIACAEKLVN